MMGAAAGTKHSRIQYRTTRRRLARGCHALGLWAVWALDFFRVWGDDAGGKMGTVQRWLGPIKTGNGLCLRNIGSDLGRPTSMQQIINNT